MTSCSCFGILLFSSLLALGCGDERTSRVDHRTYVPADTGAPADPDSNLSSGLGIETAEVDLEADLYAADPVATSRSGATTEDSQSPPDKSPAGSSSAPNDITSGTTSSDGSATTKALPGDQVFALDQVLEIRVSLADAQWKDLEEQGNLEQYIPAAASVIGTNGVQAQFETVGFRHKGAG
ncbi:MAG TPA: hypothetical protein VKP30_31660, partial [Polyangiaceae bacterium]|nr:hypothetical protein [Polyangiaceae bacterium]